MTSTLTIRDKINSFAIGRRRLIGLAITRIGLGATTALIYITGIQFRETLYGPHGELSFQSFLADQRSSTSVFSLYSLSQSEFWFNLVYFAGLAAALAWMIFGGRSLTAVNAIFVWSLQERNMYLGDGGDNVARIVLILLIFTTTNAYFAPHAKKVRARLEALGQQPRLANSIHNVVAMLIVFQVCIVYTVAGLWKVVSDRWREGNALFYIGYSHQFDYTKILPWLMHSSIIVTVVCYLTITVQLCMFPAALTRHRWLREIILLLIAGMHFGIMYGMGLVSFGLIMISVDASIMRDSDYRITYSYIRDAARKLFGSRAAAPVSLVGVPDVAAASRISEVASFAQRGVNP